MTHALSQWLSRGRFHLHNGHQVFYIDEGSGPATDAIFIIHGYPNSSFEWKEVIDKLSTNHRVVAFDLLGMGFSDKPHNYKYSYEDYVSIVKELIQKLSLRKIHFLTHDLGVSVMQELLSQYEENLSRFQIESIAFVNGGLFMDTYKPRLIQRVLSQSPDLIGKLISRNLSKKMFDNSISQLFGPEHPPSTKYLEEQWELLNYKEGKAIAYLLGRLVFEKLKYQSRWISAMQHTSIPMCFINGPHDPNSGEHMARRYEELIPAPRVERLKSTIGHWPQVEDPDEVIRAYKDFLSEP